MDIPESVLAGIEAAGFTKCTPVQNLALPDILNGKDVAAQAQTGTGKTAAFLIGIYARMFTVRPHKPGSSPRVLIIAPTRELVVQIEAEARVLGGPSGFRILSVYGGVDYEKQRAQLAGRVDVLIGTPGRLIDYLKQKVYSLKKTQFLVIDEADRMFDMGFISDLRFLLRRMSPYNRRQSLLFSETLTTRVMELCYEHMNDPERISVTPDQVTVEQVEQEIYHVGKSEKFGLLLDILRRGPGGRYLIFCNMKITVEKLDNLLNANGYKSAAIMGSLDQRKRLKVLSRFKDGELPILVATEVAGRGLHIEGVTHVINYDLPQDPDDYVHRIGRTARAGAVGKAISLACEDYVTSLPDIEEFIKFKIPVIHITDEMIVTDYKRAPVRKRSAPPRRKGTQRKDGQRKPKYSVKGRGTSPSGAEKQGRRTPRRGGKKHDRPSQS